MADNTRGGSQDGGDPLIASDEVTYSGDTADVQLMRPVHVTGSEGSKTVVALDIGTSDGTSAAANSQAQMSGIGPGFSRRYNPSNLGTAVDSVSTIDINGAATLVVSVETTVTGDFQIEISNDGTNWTLPDVSTFDAEGGLTNSQIINPSAGKNYIVPVSGIRKARIRTTGTLSATLAHSFTLSAAPAVMFVTGGSGGMPVYNGQDIFWDPGDNQTDELGPLRTTLGYVFDGTTWDRQRGTAADGTLVNLGANNDVTVTGTVAVTQSGTWDEVGINDSGNSITVDGTITASNTAGDVAHGTGDSGNPVKIGLKAANAFPPAEANADRVNAIGDLFGRQMTTHIDPAQQVWKSYNDTASRAAGSAQVVWDPTGGKRIAVTSFVVSAYGTTAGRIFLFFADDADLTYTAGTDQPLLVASYAPSTTSKPGTVWTSGQTPIFCLTADRRLHYQNDAAISVDIVIYGYEW